MIGRTPPQVVLIDPGGARTQLTIAKVPFTIGRLGDNDAVLGDCRVSRHHTTILLENGHYVIKDEGSRHGTFVNGERVEAPRPLRNNDRIEFGIPGSTTLLFVSEEESLHNLLERVETPAGTRDSPSRELRSLNLLLEVGRSLQAGLALEEVLATVVDACVKVIGTERGFLFLRSEQGELELRVGRDNNKNSLPPGDFQGSLSIIRDAARGDRDIFVTNSMADERVSNRASVVSLELRTITCLPLRRLPLVGSQASTVTGLVAEVLGVIYLDSRRISQPSSETEKQVLRSLAAEAAGVIENARLFEAARAKERLDQELAIARDIQQALLPKRFREYDYFGVAGINIPSQQVGGDYYDLIEMPDHGHAVVVADVCGKGISAALLTSALQGALAAMVELGQPVNAVARQLNHYLCQHAGVNKFATFFCGVLEPGGQFDYVNAGHVPPLWVNAKEEMKVLTAESLPLGLFDQGEYAARRLTLQPGDTLVLYTDGFLEAADPRGELYGVERLKTAVRNYLRSPVDDLADGILRDIREFSRGTPPGDDMTLLVVRYEGRP